MKTRMAIATAALVLSAGSAFAGPVVVGTTVLADSYGDSGGGEFNATKDKLDVKPLSLGGGSGPFETFCMEYYEGAGFNANGLCADMNDRTVATNAAYSAGARGGFQDPLDTRTAYLYSQFITGVLAGYNYSPGAGRVETANALQAAIWLIEDELTALEVTQKFAPAEVTQANAFVTAATAAVLDGYKNGGVVVFNLYTKDDSGARVESQDILGLVIVPLPTSALAGMSVLGGLALVRRRRA